MSWNKKSTLIVLGRVIPRRACFGRCFRMYDARSAELDGLYGAACLATIILCWNVRRPGCKDFDRLTSELSSLVGDELTVDVSDLIVKVCVKENPRQSENGNGKTNCVGREAPRACKDTSMMR